MLAVAFTFPAGRYHATPWDRHVNEAAVAWPPEPWRILRALIATWHHKLSHQGRHSEATLSALIESLAASLPEYHLPPANHSHTRHYMPQAKAGDTALVFDAFAALAKDAALTVGWPGVELPADEAALLDDLLAVMGYLGRAESWVEARRVPSMPPANCRPGDDPLDPETGEIHGEHVPLVAALPPAEYRALRAQFLADRKNAKRLAPTLPEGLLGALQLDTAAWRKQGWNRPPAARHVGYLRPIDALRPVRTVTRAVPARATTAQFVITGKPLPRVEDSLRIGELARAAVMGVARRLFGEDGVPPALSGHDLPGDNRHGHAFYLPWDSDGDGRIDRLLLHVPQGLEAAQQQVLHALQQLWQRDGAQWPLVLESLGQGAGHRLLAASRCWQSLTPYLHPWHRKKGFEIEDQLRRECRARGWPEPQTLQPLPAISVGHQPRRPTQFHRWRTRRGLAQPDRSGSFWRLTFAEPVAGPIALGFACHYGLGLFAPVEVP